MRRKTVLIGGVSLAAIAVAATVAVFVLVPQATPPEPDPVTATVTRETITKTVTGRGTIDAGSRASAAFVDSGTITGISVSVGQTVTAGQELASIDPAAADLALQRAKDARWSAGSGLESAQDQLGAAQAALNDARAALAAPAPPPADPDAGPVAPPDRAALAAAVREAEGQVNSAASALVQAQVGVNDADRDVAAAQSARDATVLKAPIGGVIMAVNGTIGSITSGGGSEAKANSTGAAERSGFIEIANPATVVVTAQIAEADIRELAVDQVATVTLSSDADAAFDAKVVTIAPLPDNADGVVRFPVTVQLSEAPADLRLGLTALVTITTQEAKDVLALPAEAVTLTSSTEGTVELEDPDNPKRTRTVAVTVGLVGTELIEIRDGLSEGDTVIVPNLALVPGQEGDTGFDMQDDFVEELE